MHWYAGIRQHGRRGAKILGPGPGVPVCPSADVNLSDGEPRGAGLLSHQPDELASIIPSNVGRGLGGGFLLFEAI